MEDAIGKMTKRKGRREKPHGPEKVVQPTGQRSVMTARRFWWRCSSVSLSTTGSSWPRL